MKLFLFSDSGEFSRSILERVSKLNHQHQINLEMIRNTDMRILDEKKVRDTFFIIDEDYNYDQIYFNNNLKKHALTFIVGEKVRVLRGEGPYEELSFEQFLLRLENYIYLKMKLAKDA